AALLAAHDRKPEVDSENAGDDALTHSGFPGRPGKGKHLIDDEFDRRIAAGEALPSLVDEAKALLDWLKEHHPKVARPTTKTIEKSRKSRAGLARRFKRIGWPAAAFRTSMWAGSSAIDCRTSRPTSPRCRPAARRARPPRQSETGRSGNARDRPRCPCRDAAL